MSGRIFGTYWEVGVVGSSHARPRVRHTTRGLIDRCGRMRMEMLVGRTQRRASFLVVAVEYFYCIRDCILGRLQISQSFIFSNFV